MLELPGLTVLALDSSVPGSFAGAIPVEDLAAAHEALEAHSDHHAPILIALHHPPVPDVVPPSRFPWKEALIIRSERRSWFLLFAMLACGVGLVLLVVTNPGEHWGWTTGDFVSCGIGAIAATPDGRVSLGRDRVGHFRTDAERLKVGLEDTAAVEDTATHLVPCYASYSARRPVPAVD